jgi:hypothetical protein
MLGIEETCQIIIADIEEGGRIERRRGNQRLATRFRSRLSSSISMDSFGGCMALLKF